MAELPGPKHFDAAASSCAAGSNGRSTVAVGIAALSLSVSAFRSRDFPESRHFAEPSRWADD